jgi:imidazolonepropionase-like amidohydrolase
LLIEEGRIVAIGTNDRGSTNNMTTVDAKGKYAIPGLFDMHVHGWGANQEAFLAYGVTSVRDTGGWLANENALLDREQSTNDPVPRYFYAGEIFEGKNPYWGDVFLLIHSPEEGRRYVQNFKKWGAQFIKVYDSLTWRIKRAVVDEAHKAGLPVVGHGLSAEEITKSVTLGFHSIEHAPTRIYADVVEMLAKSQTHWDPTLSVDSGNAMLLRNEPQRLSNSKFLEFTPESYIQFAKTGSYFAQVDDVGLRGTFMEELAAIHDAYQRGVHLLVGTDAPNPECFYGSSLHWELEHFASAGISAPDILRIATLDAARAVGAEKDLGSLEPGKLADLVLLDANPLENIRNTQTIWRVIKGGWIYDPAKIHNSSK